MGMKKKSPIFFEGLGRGERLEGILLNRCHGEVLQEDHKKLRKRDYELRERLTW